MSRGANDSRPQRLTWVFVGRWGLKGGLNVCIGETNIGLSEVNFKVEKDCGSWTDNFLVRIPVCIAAWKERCFI